MKKILLRVLLGLGVLLLGLIAFVNFTWDKKFDAPYPDIQASTDSAMIARGRYLVYGPAHCATCHVPMDKIESVEAGEQIPLTGGWELAIEPGTFRAPNLTPDKETGIGRYTDKEVARALRHMVKPNGRIMFPFMPFQNLSDEDLTAVISFLRSQEPIKNDVKPSEPTFLGKALLAFGVLKPEGPTGTPPKSVAIEPTAAYGSYLANSVANCKGCHTDRDLKTGEFTGEPFAGGFAMPPDAFSKGYAFITPNLTPDKETGLITEWTEDAFVARIQAGRVHAGSAMPWGSFSRMDTTDLKALYQFLHTLKPVSNKIAKTVYAPGEKFPE